MARGFRAHKGVTPYKPAFAAHAALIKQTVYAAHTTQAITYAKVKAAKATPAKAKIITYKSALPKAPAAWTEKKRTAAKYKPVKP